MITILIVLTLLPFKDSETDFQSVFADPEALPISGSLSCPYLRSDGCRSLSLSMTQLLTQFNLWICAGRIRGQFLKT